MILNTTGDHPPLSEIEISGSVAGRTGGTYNTSSNTVIVALAPFLSVATILRVYVFGVVVGDILIE